MRIANVHLELRTLGGLTIPIEGSAAPLQNPYTDPSMMESEADKSFSQTTLQQTSVKRFNTNDVAIAQREREINEIAQGIIELAEIFKELQNMVIDQGTMLDRIDYNVENMAINVKAADQELNVVCCAKTTCRPPQNTDNIFVGNKLPAKIHQAQGPFPTCSSCRWHDYSSHCKTKAYKCTVTSTFKRP